MILVLRALGLGDLATAVPAIRGLRTVYPAEPLALAAPVGLTPLIDLIGGVSAVVDTPGLDARLPDDLQPAIAVNLHGSGPESHRLLQAVSPSKLWAFRNAEAGHFDGPPWIFAPPQTAPHPGWVGPTVAPGPDDPIRLSTGEEHEVARWCRLLDHYGVPADREELGLATPNIEVPRGLTIIHPGAKSGTRRWPPERFAAVARALRADGHRIVVTAGGDERPLGVRVAEAAGLTGHDVPTTGLGELAALVAHARLVISGDTGISHLATAYGTPSVTLFGPMSPERWGPPDRAYHRKLWKGTRSEPGDRPGPPHPALLAIGEKEVLEAAREALG
ncbi:glycosyltransferase family 9 protein [Actinoplanes sp. NPDC051343]|uniref:glycosyltransferase family 9 protein n=1 Tax=Actinoplanes sp. NPDC051343 TaxID=3363906 RepID=UPI003792F371